MILQIFSYILYLQVLVGPTGLMSGSPLEQQGAVNSLCTLMTISPSDTYLEFEKVKHIMFSFQCKC